MNKLYVIKSSVTDKWWSAGKGRAGRWVDSFLDAKLYRRRGHANNALSFHRETGMVVSGGEYEIIEYEIIPTGRIHKVRK